MPTTDEIQQINALLEACTPEWEEPPADSCEREWVYFHPEGEWGRGSHRSAREAFHAAEAQARKHLDFLNACLDWDIFPLVVYCPLTQEWSVGAVRR